MPFQIFRAPRMIPATITGSSSDDMVLALDHAARIGPGRDMTEADVTRERAEERNSLADEHGKTTDDQAVYEAGTQKLLNRDATGPPHSKQHRTDTRHVSIKLPPPFSS